MSVIGVFGAYPNLCPINKIFFMSAIIILVLVSVAVAVLFLVLFIGAVKRGQYDDDYSPAVRILFDEETSDSDKSQKQP